MTPRGGTVPGRVALGGQVLLAAALPWLTGTLLGTGETWWAVIVLMVVTAFTVVHRDIALVWLLPVAALVSLSPVFLDLPSWSPAVAAMVAAAAGATVMSRVPSAPPGEGSTALAILGWTVAAIGALTGVVAMAVTTSSDAAFEAGQADAAEAWDAPLISTPETAFEDPPATDTDPAGTLTTTPAAPNPSTEAPPGRTAGPTTDLAKASSAAEDAVFIPLPLAQLAFTRPGADSRPVTARTLYVGDDVTEATLTRGPGHYPTTAQPGAPGNFAVAGHRTGWGSPFLGLDELRSGDRIRVTERGGAVHVYVVDRAETVDPDDAWVLGPDPLGTGRPTLTLITCDPPGVNDRRLVVFATLRG